MRAIRLVLLFAFYLLPPVATSQEYTSSQLQQFFVENTRHLCEWAKTNAPEGNPVVIHACEPGTEASFYQADRDMSDWWQHWYDQDSGLYYKLKSAWDDEVNRLNAQREATRKAAAQKQAKAARARTVQALPTMPVTDVCKYARRRKMQEAVEELSRRNAFTASDRALIAEGAVNLGMSEGAMLCSLGSPQRSNRSVGSWGVHIQYVYDGITVYTENGKVTSWQD